MENNNLKEKIQKRVKEKIAIANLKEEIGMKQVKNRKIFYGALASCALLVLCVGIVISKLPEKRLLQAKLSNNLLQTEEEKENKQMSDMVELNIKEIEDLTTLDYAIDGRRTKIDGKVINTDLKHSIYVKLPQDITEVSGYQLYVKGKDTKEYNVLHSYEFCYTNQEQTRTITLEVGVNGNIPLRDYYMLEVEKKSRIGTVELEITKYQDLYLVLFTHKGIHFDIETKGIHQEELVQFLKSIICENNTYPGMKMEK